MKHKKGMTFTISLLFIGFFIITVILVGITTYISQMDLYRKQCEKDIQNVAWYLEGLIEAEGEDFRQYTAYFKEHFREEDIPADADEYLSYQEKYDDLFHKKYPGKTLGVDIEFEDLDPEVKDAWFVYTHLYWLLTFEKAAHDFHLDYAYFLLPDEENHTVMYMIDGERNSRASYLEFLEENPQYKKNYQEQGNDSEYLYLGDTYDNPPEEHKLLWKTWETGEAQPGIMVWHNRWGNDFGYYVPVQIDGEKLGLTVAEIGISDMNQQILMNALRQMAIIGLILALCFILLRSFISRRYVKRIEQLEASVEDYTFSKNADIAADIEKNIRYKDEISNLSKGIISMIMEIETYVKNLTLTSIELHHARDTAGKMSKLALLDSLTGIRNRNAYDEEILCLQEEIANGLTELGIAVIDMNDLKMINDTYGHESGNQAIRALCAIVCEIFKHSPVFRIGGDEFLVVLKNEDYRNRQSLERQFHEQMQSIAKDRSLKPWQKVSGAIGIAIYEGRQDNNVISIFKRADARMYADKRNIKTTSGVR